MARSTVKIELDRAAILRLSTSTADRLADNAAQSAQRYARREAPRQTGALAASIEIRKIRSGVVTTYAIGSRLDYARYQEFGTGPIVPRTAKVLHFKVGGKNVFAMRTRGVPATHFMRNASLRINLSDFVA